MLLLLKIRFILKSSQPRLPRLKIFKQLNLIWTSGTKLVPHGINQTMYYARILRLTMRRRIASLFTFNDLLIIIMMEYLFDCLVLGSLLLLRSIPVNIITSVCLSILFSAELYINIHFDIAYWYSHFLPSWMRKLSTRGMESASFADSKLFRMTKRFSWSVFACGVP